MTEHEKEVLRELIGNLLLRKISEEEFKKKCPINVSENSMVIKELLEKATQEKNADDYEILQMMVWIFKLYLQKEYIELICKSSRETWHFRHEDIALLLEEVRSPYTVDCIYDLAIMDLKYMEFDEFFNIARKCSYALGKINTPKAKEKLELLAKNTNELIREYALKQLTRHSFLEEDVEGEQY